MFSRNNCNRKTYVSSMLKWYHIKKNVLNGPTTVRSLKTYEIHSGGGNRILQISQQFSWLKILLVYKISNQHTMICDSYNAELAAKNRFFDSGKHHKQLFDCQRPGIQSHKRTHQTSNFTTLNYEACSIALLIDCANNQMYQELTTVNNFFKTSSNESLHSDLKDSKSYTGDLGRLRRKDNNMNLYLTLKSAG